VEQGPFRKAAEVLIAHTRAPSRAALRIIQTERDTGSKAGPASREAALYSFDHHSCYPGLGYEGMVVTLPSRVPALPRGCLGFVVHDAYRGERSVPVVGRSRVSRKGMWSL
jgi:hypothetical protein